MLNIFVGHRENYGSIPISLVEFRFRSGKDHRVSCFVQHNHETMEMLSVRKGVLRVVCNGEQLVLHPGDHVFFNPYDAHTGDIEPEDGDTHYICLMLESELCAISSGQTTLNRVLEEVRQGKVRFRTCYPAEAEESAAITEAILALCSHYRYLLTRQDAAVECLLMSELFRLLAILQKDVSETPPELLCSRDLHFIRQISDYVKEHYAGAVDVDSLCVDLGYSERNFYRLFRQNFAMTFTEYLREYRIRCAAENYRGSDLSLSEISAAVGFTDYCYFSRTFKKYTGQSPCSYFRK